MVSRFFALQFRRRGVEQRLLLHGRLRVPRPADPALLKALARARGWFEEIASGHMRSVAAIARREKLPKRYATKLFKLAFLAPDLIDAVINGGTPVELNLQALMDGRIRLDLAWNAQARLLGIGGPDP